MKCHKAAGAAALLVLSLLACEHREPVGAASMQAPGVDDAVISELTSARCDREQRCDRVGPGKQFASVEACGADVRAKVSAELDVHNCPGGLERESVRQCLSAIRAEACDQKLGSLASFEKCRGESLCMQQGYRRELTR